MGKGNGEIERLGPIQSHQEIQLDQFVKKLQIDKAQIAATKRFEDEIKKSSPKKSHAILDGSRKERGTKEEMNFQPESVMNGEHFAQILGKAFVEKLNFLQLKELAKKDNNTLRYMDADQRETRNFNMLISLIAEKAYLDFGIVEDGRRYTKLDSEISRLSRKIDRIGLPSDFSFSLSGIEIKTKHIKRDTITDGDDLFIWAPSKAMKIAGGSTMIAATLAGCGGKASSTVVAPVRKEDIGEINVEKEPIEEIIATATAAAEYLESLAHTENTEKEPSPDILELIKGFTDTDSIQVTDGGLHRTVDEDDGLTNNLIFRLTSGINSGNATIKIEGLPIPGVMDGAEVYEISKEAVYGFVTENGTSTEDIENAIYITVTIWDDGKLEYVLIDENGNPKTIHRETFNAEKTIYEQVEAKAVSDSETTRHARIKLIESFISKTKKELEETEKYTLLNGKILQGDDTIPWIKISSEGAMFGGGDEWDIAELIIAKNQLIVTQNEVTLVFDGEEWVNIPALPKDFSSNWIISETAITDEDGVAKYDLSEDGLEWVEVVGWPIEMDFAKCLEITVAEEDLKPGERLDQFLAQIKPELMAKIDWANIKDDIRFTNTDGTLIYWMGDNTGVKFVNPDLNPDVPDTNPFDKNIGVCGKVTFKNGNSYILTVHEIRDKNAPTETGYDIYFLKLLLPLQHADGTKLTPFEIEFIINTWKEMHIAPVGLNSNPMREPGGFKDSTFAHIEEESPEFEIWFPAYLSLMRGEPIHGPLSEFKKLEPYLWPTHAYNVDSNMFK